VASFFAGGSGGGSPRSRWADRIIGIVVGVVLGLGVLVYFVFVHSEGTIDAPKVNEGKAESNLPAHPGSPEKPAEDDPGGSPQPAGESKGGEPGTAETTEAVPVVKVIGGAPPTGSGPKQLHFTKGEKVRFVIETSEPFSFEIKGLGITQSIESTSTVAFKATKAGQFPVIATATLIGVADILISPRR
jgi:cell division protein FtsN